MKQRHNHEMAQMIVTAQEAQLLCVHCGRLRRWADRALIPAYPISLPGNYRFKSEDIARFLSETNKQGAG